MKDNSDYNQWGMIKRKLKQLYPTLTPADLIWRYGTKNEMIETISSKLGISAKELKENIDDL
jgi:hypothetical protein